MSRGKRRRRASIRHEGLPPKGAIPSPEECEPDWSLNCDSCGNSPVMPATGLCGPCTFGEAETEGGNW